MFDIIVLSFATVVAICFSYFAISRLWSIGKKEKTYCVIVCGVILMLLVFAWGYGVSTGLFSKLS